MKSMPTRTFLTLLLALIAVTFSSSYAYAGSKASDKVDLMRGFEGKIELDIRSLRGFSGRRNAFTNTAGNFDPLG